MRYGMWVLTLFIASFACNPLLYAEKPEEISGFHADVIWQIDAAAEKLISLAEAMPQEKYTWRPGEGVRSVSEVYTHIVSGVYFILKYTGIDPPADLNRESLKDMTDKEKVIAALKQSMEFARQGVRKVSVADLEKKTNFFGESVSYRWLLLQMTIHMHEHLGQSIAYARMNGVIPPWSIAE